MCDVPTLPTLYQFVKILKSNVSVHADATIPERLFAASARTRWLSQGLHAKFNNAYCRCMPFLFSNSVTEPSTQKTKKITSYDDPFNNNN